MRSGVKAAIWFGGEILCFFSLVLWHAVIRLLFPDWSFTSVTTFYVILAVLSITGMKLCHDQYKRTQHSNTFEDD